MHAYASLSPLLNARFAGNLGPPLRQVNAASKHGAAIGRTLWQRRSRCAVTGPVRRSRACIVAPGNQRHTGASSLEQRNLGRSGLIVSAVGLGCNNFGGRMDMAATRAVVHKALDLGDHVLRHGGHLWRARRSEEYLGRALAGRRHDIVLATQIRPADGPRGALQGASRRYIMSAVEASLRRLGTDYIDLY